MKFRQEHQKSGIKKQTKNLAISNVSYELSKNSPHLLHEWFKNVQTGKFKLTRVFRQEYNRLIEQEISGKPYPQKPSRPTGNIEVTKLLRQKPVVSSSEILFSKHDKPIDKINKVLSSDMSQTDKDDFLSHLTKQM